MPEHGVLEPLPLREAQERLDLRAHVELILAAIERGQEGHDRHLFDERPIARFGQPQPGLDELGLSWAGRHRSRS